MCKVTKEPDRFRHVSGGGFIGSREIPDVDLLPAACDLGAEAPVSVLKHTFAAGRAVRSDTLVGEIFSAAANANISAPIVQSVAIGVVNVGPFRGAQNDAVHPSGCLDAVSFNPSDGVDVPTLADFGSAPIVPGYEMHIGGIDDGAISIAQWDNGRSPGDKDRFCLAICHGEI